DPALLRPGRFDRQVVVDRPDLKGREAILKVHARGVALGEDVDLQVIAARTPGFTGADLANVVNEAALLAARREKDSVGEAELEEAIDRVSVGLERKSRVMSSREREITAVHEMGHALVGLDVKNADYIVHRVSIIPRGTAALGMTLYRPLEDRYISTEAELKDQLAISLGGRTAEELVFGHLSTGAADDLRRATDLARRMITEAGMSKRLGPVAYGQDGLQSAEGRYLFPGQRPEISEHTAQIIDEEVGSLMSDARDAAAVILKERRELLDRLSKLLVVRETLEGDELKAYVEGSSRIPDLDEERKRLDSERAEQTRRDEEKKAAALAATPQPAAPGAGEIPPPPPLREPTEDLPRS
ncbi:MAG: ATP-dependent zinc metalloprotease FtsH, partial [Actinomycetota bacterium]